MQQKKYIMKGRYVYEIDVRLNNPTNRQGPFTVIISKISENPSSAFAVAVFTLRGKRGERLLFDTVDEAFQQAQQVIEQG